MAEDKKKDEKAQKGEAAEKAEASPEEAAAKSKKKRLLLFIIGGVVLTAAIGGGAAFFLAGGEGSKMSAKTAEEHGEGKAEGEHGEAKAEGEHGEAKAEHGEAKAEHGEAKAEGEHGEKKEGEHGEAKEGEHGGGAKKDEKKVAKLEGVDFGCTMDLKPFHLNLGNPLENRYIRIEVSVEYGCAEETKAEFDKRTPQLRDAIIAVTSRKTREFLLGPDGKEQLRKEIETQINQRMVSKIKDVYITDILIE